MHKVVEGGARRSVTTSSIPEEAEKARDSGIFTTLCVTLVEDAVAILDDMLAWSR